MRRSRFTSLRTVAYRAAMLGCGLAITASAVAGDKQSVARIWNEQQLFAISNDNARPTVHSRNLYHVAAAMYDAWAVYSPSADQIYHHEKRTAADVPAARNQAISFAAYRVLLARYTQAPGAANIIPALHNQMIALGYNPDFKSINGPSPAAVGNRVALTILFHGLNDGANEANNYVNQIYAPENPPIVPALPGNPDMIDPNTWQPLALEFFIDQSGNVILGGYPQAVTMEWGQVGNFALSPADLTINLDEDGNEWHVYHDPGPVPQLNGADGIFRWGHQQCLFWSSHLDPTDGVMWDISPGAMGNSPMPVASPTLEQYNEYYDLLGGGDWGEGYDVNPVTGLPYTPNIVPRGDYARVLAQYWSDGPGSVTPPGHWFLILNEVMDHPLFTRQFHGVGPELDALEYDVRAYLALGGSVHDTAVACWGAKGWYDSSRPISANRYMADRGQYSDPKLPSYHPEGLELIPGYIELVTAESVNAYHAHLAGNEGKIAVLAWRGPEYLADPEVDEAGVGWILVENWWPFFPNTFVTPPFPGYTSGHSAYSRGAAEVMTRLTGDEYFPGGLHEIAFTANEFLEVEDGPSIDLTFQYAKYGDASDHTSMSRIWGGIHPGFDDIPSRHIGLKSGPDAFNQSVLYYYGLVSCREDIFPLGTGGDGVVDSGDLGQLLSNWGTCEDDDLCLEDVFPTFEGGHGDREIGGGDLAQLLSKWGQCK